MTRQETKAALLKVLETVPVDDLRLHLDEDHDDLGGCVLQRALGMWRGWRGSGYCASVSGLTPLECIAIGRASDLHDATLLRSLIEAL